MDKGIDIGRGWTVYPSEPGKALRYNHVLDRVDEREVDDLAAEWMIERARIARQDSALIWPEGWERHWSWWLHPAAWWAVRRHLLAREFRSFDRVVDPDQRKLWGIPVDDSHTELIMPDLVAGKVGTCLLVRRA